MSTSAVYSFIGNPSQNQPDIHLVYHSDGYPKGAADVISNLTPVVNRIWAGEQVDLSALNLPHVDQVQRRETLENSRPATPYRYQIEYVDGRQVITALQHSPIVSEELQQRVESARQALADAETAMTEALSAPNYTQIGKGSINKIRSIQTY